ncbi:AAA family ATPase [Mycobacterium manitobense]|uniref:AAA family ATPase n=1 Tax=[Mycobacterium] manitobense TaxID=190147 RepID=A0A9X2YEP8_9MYCO|nr:AAA family ATPase [[Mycobacterium] manitobense]MCV7173077.1 AAA family ATPase [[Mycobacterium] manitobense]
MIATDHSAAYERLTAALRDQGRVVRETGDGKAMAQCPAHDDRNPSLSIAPRRDGKGVVVHCHAGCDIGAVTAAVGLQLRDLFDDDRMRAVYADTGTYAYPGGREVHRRPGKDFRQTGNKADRSLYHGDRIADRSTVYVVEGERDVHAVESQGGAAVSPAMGAGKSHLADWSALKGKEVVVVADADEAGRKHAAEVAEIVGRLGNSIRIVEARTGKDVADHIAAGHSLDELAPRAKADVRPADMPRLWRAAELADQEQGRWLAKNWLPLAAVALLIGDEGIGKSLLWVLIIAHVTTGKPMPAMGIPAREPQAVVIVVTEDDWKTTVRPRLTVAGVNLDMVHVICTDRDGSGAPVFPRDVDLLDGLDFVLLVVDAWLDTVPASLSVRDPQQARQALHPFKELASREGCAVAPQTTRNTSRSPERTTDA